MAGLAEMASAIHFLAKNFSQDFLERGITLSEVGVTKAEIRAFNPDLLNYISHLHIAVAGLAMALGLALALLAWFGIKRRQRWAWWAAVVVGLVAGTVALPSHFVYGFATAPHLGPDLLGGLIFLVGLVLTYPEAGRP